MLKIFHVACILYDIGSTPAGGRAQPKLATPTRLLDSCQHDKKRGKIFFLNEAMPMKEVINS
jgi:hypothetical protein